MTRRRPRARGERRCLGCKARKARRPRRTFWYGAGAESAGQRSRRGAAAPALVVLLVRTVVPRVVDVDRLAVRIQLDLVLDSYRRARMLPGKREQFLGVIWPHAHAPVRDVAALEEPSAVGIARDRTVKTVAVLPAPVVDVEPQERESTEVRRMPALHLVVVVAQGAPGRDGMYRLRMPDTLVEKVYSWAQSRNALVFLDVQVGKSTVMAEVPRLEQFLKRPNVHLGLDPEFSMKGGEKPGSKIGVMTASDINWSVRYLSGLTKKYNLPPKVLVVHRFTRKMVTGAKDIELDPGVQVVIDMDGWGGPWLKYDSYRDYVAREPVQFTGFKLFYHNDTKKGDPLLTPGELLMLTPKPVYIQYQ